MLTFAPFLSLLFHLIYADSLIPRSPYSFFQGSYVPGKLLKYSWNLDPPGYIPGIL